MIFKNVMQDYRYNVEKELQHDDFFVQSFIKKLY